MGIVRREKSENYSVIYNECFHDDSLSARSKGVFAYLMTLPDDWKIYKSELHTHFREGRDAISNALKELEDAGYVTKKPVQDGSGKLGGWDYTVYESTELLRTRTESLKNRNTVNPSDGKPVTTKYLSLQSTNNTNTVEANASPERASKAKKTRYTEGFEQFWTAYPRKVGKGGAFKAFLKADQPIAGLLVAVEKQKRSEQWRKEGGQYIPHPATWLNQGRWDDEVPGDEVPREYR